MAKSGMLLLCCCAPVRVRVSPCLSVCGAFRGNRARSRRHAAPSSLSRLFFSGFAPASRCDSTARNWGQTPFEARKHWMKRGLSPDSCPDPWAVRCDETVSRCVAENSRKEENTDASRLTSLTHPFANPRLSRVCAREARRLVNQRTTGTAERPEQPNERRARRDSRLIRHSAAENGRGGRRGESLNWRMGNKRIAESLNWRISE